MINFYNLHNKKLNMYDEYYKSISLCSTTGFQNNPDYDFTPIMHIIKRTPGIAVLYSQYILKDRWPDVEPIILLNHAAAILYAKDVIKGRWPELENMIISISRYVYYYSFCVIGHRWIEAEMHNKGGFSDYWWARYQQEF